MPWCKDSLPKEPNRYLPLSPRGLYYTMQSSEFCSFHPLPFTSLVDLCDLNSRLVILISDTNVSFLQGIARFSIGLLNST